MIDERAKTLGNALVKAGILKEDQLKKAIERASTENAPTLIISLLELEYLTFKVFEKFVLSTMGIKSTIISSHDLNPALVAKIGAHLINSKLVYPISTKPDRDSKLLALGMVDPTDESTIKRVENSTGWKVIPILISLPDFKEATTKNKTLMPALSEIDLQPDTGPLELQMDPSSSEPKPEPIPERKIPQVPLKGDENVGGMGRRFREEVLAKLDLEPAEIPIFTEPTYSREVLGAYLRKVGAKSLQNIYDRAPDDIKVEGLINLLIAKGIIIKNDILISTAVSLVFKGGRGKK